jgi:N-acetylglucosaminyldiphosphoundecaprenol N-acetyl-beta-D-mannosaminyltransferase
LDTHQLTKLKSLDILGIRVHCVNKSTLLNQVINWAQENTARTIFYVNAHCINVAVNDPDHRKVLNHADLVYSDGIGVVWAARMLNNCPLQKITGRDWINAFGRLAAGQGLRIYLLAGEPGVTKKAAETLKHRWPDLKIIGAQDGFFQEKSEGEILADIAAKRPHVVLVGMNTPQQEKWIAKHRGAIYAPVCWAVGALFDYVAGVEPPVPVWMNTLALEWLWRLLMDPLGKWRRYLVGIPLFTGRVLRQRLISGEKRG